MALDDLQLTGVIPASGELIVSWRPFARQNWTVQQVSTEAPDVGSTAQCGLYRDGFRITALIPTGTQAGGLPYAPQRNGSTMYVQWTGATPGATVKVFVIYDDGT